MEPLDAPGEIYASAKVSCIWQLLNLQMNMPGHGHGWQRSLGPYEMPRLCIVHQMLESHQSSMKDLHRLSPQGYFLGIRPFSQMQACT